MRLQTEAAVDANGKPIPVFVPDTKATVAVTLSETLANSSPASTTFGATSKTFPSCSLLSDSEGDTVLITSKLGGSDGCHISVTVAGAEDNEDDAVIVSVSGKDITITPDDLGSTLTDVAAAINNAASKLVTAVVVGDGDSTLDANAKQYLRGWDAGGLATLVQLYNAADGICFIGCFPESDLGTPTASMAIPSGYVQHIMVEPGEKIVAQAASGATGTLYLTPMRKY